METAIPDDSHRQNTGCFHLNTAFYATRINIHIGNRERHTYHMPMCKQESVEKQAKVGTDAAFSSADKLLEIRKT